jgi:DMSO/TMAO reductase YedYZ molybdopterin-dependent catalytic subunit
VLPRRTALLVSIVTFAVAVGGGHLVAGLHSPGSSPYWAVANAAVRLAPDWLVNVGKSMHFFSLGAGRADKAALLVGVGTTVFIIAVVAGLASRRSDRTGRRILAATGLVGLAAVWTAPSFKSTDLLAPLAALALGSLAFRWLHHLARAAAQPPESTSSGAAMARRSLLITAGTGVGAVVAGGVGQLLHAGIDLSEDREQVRRSVQIAIKRFPAPPLPGGAAFVSDGTPPFITANTDFYRIDTALSVPTLAASDWRLRIHGLVDNPLSLKFADLLNLPLLHKTITMTCVSNIVGGGLVSSANFLGVDLRSVLGEVGIRPGADQLLSSSADGWSAGTPIDVVMEMDRGAMLAFAMNGEPLPPEHGYPVRMIVPGLYGYVSATKWLVDLELTTFARQAYWVKRNWAARAPIKTQSRIDRPQELDQVRAGQLVVAGVAWAQHRGIEKVEVRVDGGAWQTAQLTTEVTSDTWRMWRTTINISPGTHLVESRATDKTGLTQTPVRTDPVPDGASGWPRVTFTAV